MENKEATSSAVKIVDSALLNRAAQLRVVRGLKSAASWDESAVSKIETMIEAWSYVEAKSDEIVLVLGQLVLLQSFRDSPDSADALANALGYVSGRLRLSTDDPKIGAALKNRIKTFRASQKLKKTDEKKPEYEFAPATNKRKWGASMIKKKIVSDSD